MNEENAANINRPVSPSAGDKEFRQPQQKRSRICFSLQCSRGFYQLLYTPGRYASADNTAARHFSATANAADDASERDAAENKHHGERTRCTRQRAE